MCTYLQTENTIELRNSGILIIDSLNSFVSLLLGETSVSMMISQGLFQKQMKFFIISFQHCFLR